MPPKRNAAADASTSRKKRKATSSTQVSKGSSPTGFESYPPAKVYRLIEPGPVLLVSTGSFVDETHNIMTIGFHMVLQHESPPLLSICVGPWDASFALLKEHRECVLAIPAVEMAGVVVDIGNCSADDEDVADAGGKFARFGLEALPASKVKAALVGGPDVIANVECVVHDDSMVDKYSMWVVRPVKAWINPEKRPGESGRMFHHRGDGTFVADGDVLDLQDRMVKWKEYQN